MPMLNVIYFVPFRYQESEGGVTVHAKLFRRLPNFACLLVPTPPGKQHNTRLYIHVRILHSLDPCLFSRSMVVVAQA